MDIDFNEDNQAIPSKGLNDSMNISDEWVPICDDALKPNVGMVFDTLEEGASFYKSYAHVAGFSVRNSSEMKDKYGVKWKYFLCSKEGYKEEKKIKLADLVVDDQRQPKNRRRKLIREGCNAMIVFKRTTEEKFEVQRFHEGHTHGLVTPSKKQFLKSSRRVTNVHKNLLICYNKANVGTSKAYQLIKEQVGDYPNIGCTQRDLQNFSRDLKGLIKDSDAHIFIDNFRRKHEMNNAFYYDYEVDDEGRLKYVFWADGLCRKNYSLFGDVISFDTTYCTNKYSMIFAPFTGVNHHRQSITFGAAFIADEKIESFLWLFKTFLKAMEGHASTYCDYNRSRPSYDNCNKGNLQWFYS